ncbi:MAG: hypothetical protein NZM28_03930 [Fimbriimonadales bacterium]|nr:hypothetical protein [Fimbriimonadales bacterium]
MRRVIIADTDVLSAFAKIERLDLLLQLFQVETIYISNSAWQEVEYSLRLGRVYAQRLAQFAQVGKLQIVNPEEEETLFAATLPLTLSEADRETLSIASKRGWNVLSNESRMAHHGSAIGVYVFSIPDLLRAFWLSKILTKRQVEDLLQLLEELDRMRFSQRTREAIFSEQQETPPS